MNKSAGSPSPSSTSNIQKRRSIKAFDSGDPTGSPVVSYREKTESADELEEMGRSMRLYLMRHGIAIDREDPDCPPDPERYLTPKGVQRTRAGARGLRALRVKPTALLTSPYVRAVQTGEIICEVLGLDCKQLKTTDALKPEAKPGKLVEELTRLSGEVICFGHAPQMDEFIAHALKATAPFTSLKKSGAACLDIDSLAPLRATLFWLLTSRTLRRLGH
jgi:phosphohistidine phosphatase